jgi:hypothetical protein
MQEFYSRFKLPTDTAKFANDAPNRASFLFGHNFSFMIWHLKWSDINSKVYKNQNKDEL